MTDYPSGRCYVKVPDGGYWPSFHQCKRAATIEREGKKYCSLHDPIAIVQKNAARSAKWEQEWAKNREIARMAAAAPDMYEALKALVDDCADYEAWQRPCLAFDNAKAALAKADGKQ